MSMWVVVLFVWLAPAILVGLMLIAMLIKGESAKGQAVVPDAAQEPLAPVADLPEPVRMLEVVN